MKLPKEITTINQMKRFAKKTAKESGEKLVSIQDKIARSLGFAAWSHMQQELDSIPIPRKKDHITFLVSPNMHNRPQEVETDILICISADHFMSELICSIQANNIQIFRSKYCDVNKLIILDFEKFCNKPRTRSELDLLINSRKEITLVTRISKDEIRSSERYKELWFYL